jgi:hypothetical protein
VTVADLIEKLSEFPQDQQVYTEGCDCWGWATDPIAQNDGPHGERPIVLITRSEKYK